MSGRPPVAWDVVRRVVVGRQTRQSEAGRIHRAAVVAGLLCLTAMIPAGGGVEQTPDAEGGALIPLAREVATCQTPADEDLFPRLDFACGGPRYLAQEPFYGGINTFEKVDPRGRPYSPEVFTPFREKRSGKPRTSSDPGQAQAAFLSAL